ncbi:MAG: hypothetical protein ACLS3C_03755 [Oscillospiraceae bacterium]
MWESCPRSRWTPSRRICLCRTSSRIPRKLHSSRRCAAAVIPCATGAGMLIEQAALNIEMWTGRSPTVR